RRRAGRLPVGRHRHSVPRHESDAGPRRDERRHRRRGASLRRVYPRREWAGLTDRCPAFFLRTAGAPILRCVRCSSRGCGHRRSPGRSRRLSKWVAQRSMSYRPGAMPASDSRRFCVPSTVGAIGSTKSCTHRRGASWRRLPRRRDWLTLPMKLKRWPALARPEHAQAGTRGLALFLVPRDLDEGRRNGYRIDRLKDKLGTRAMATGEVTLDGAYAELVGEAESGFAQMTAMLNITRLHNAITAAAIMRRACMLASTYAAQREAF